MATVQTERANEEWDEWTKPPFLRRVRIRGYKSIAFCDVELKPLTIFVGRNASGKSNFIDALAFLADILGVGVHEAIKRHGGRNEVLCRLGNDSRIRIEVETSFESEEDAELRTGTYEVESELPENRPAEIIFEQCQIKDRTGKLLAGYTYGSGQVTCVNADKKQTTHSWKSKNHPFLYHNDTPISEFADALRYVKSYNFSPDAIRELQKPTPYSFLERDGSNLASVIGSLTDVKPETISRVEAYLSVVVEEVKGFKAVRYGEYETVQFQMQSGVASQPLVFDAASMSDGTLRAFASLVAVFQFYSGPSLVCIEEPETSLHPAAMRALVDALDEATGRTQILLTTHSAEMLDNPTIRPENIRVVQMIDGQTVIGPVDEASIEIVRRKLNTLGGLERENQLEPDLEDRERQQRLAQAR